MDWQATPFCVHRSPYVSLACVFSHGIWNLGARIPTTTRDETRDGSVSAFGPVSWHQRAFHNAPRNGNFLAPLQEVEAGRRPQRTTEAAHLTQLRQSTGVAVRHLSMHLGEERGPIHATELRP